jgi:uncharacterized HAD superfamily protein
MGQPKLRPVEEVRILLRDANVVAVDYDGTCVDSMPLFVEWINERYGFNFTKADYALAKTYEALLNLDTQTIVRECRTFTQVKEGHFEMLPYAQEVLYEIAKRRSLHLVTHRTADLIEVTRESLEVRFATIFQESHFCGVREDRVDIDTHRCKSDVCLEISALVLIEDSVSTAIVCANKGVWVLLLVDSLDDLPADLPEKVIPILGGWRELREILA